MRFVLDECVDANVETVLVRAGHQCWTVPEAAMDGEDDDEVSVYADDRSAVLVTDDVDLIRRRRANLYGKAVHLRCRKVDMVRVVAEHVDVIVEKLDSAAELIVTANLFGAWVSAPPWLREPPAKPL